jgi:hypothetical protein
VVSPRRLVQACLSLVTVPILPRLLVHRVSGGQSSNPKPPPRPPVVVVTGEAPMVRARAGPDPRARARTGPGSLGIAGGPPANSGSSPHPTRVARLRSASATSNSTIHATSATGAYLNRNGKRRRRKPSANPSPHLSHRERHHTDRFSPVRTYVGPGAVAPSAPPVKAAPVRKDWGYLAPKYGR